MWGHSLSYEKIRKFYFSWKSNPSNQIFSTLIEIWMQLSSSHKKALVLYWRYCAVLVPKSIFHLIISPLFRLESSWICQMKNLLNEFIYQEFKKQKFLFLATMLFFSCLFLYFLHEIKVSHSLLFLMTYFIFKDFSRLYVGRI